MPSTRSRGRSKADSAPSTPVVTKKRASSKSPKRASSKPKNEKSPAKKRSRSRSAARTTAKRSPSKPKRAPSQPKSSPGPQRRPQRKTPSVDQTPKSGVASAPKTTTPAKTVCPETSCFGMPCSVKCESVCKCLKECVVVLATVFNLAAFLLGPFVFYTSCTRTDCKFWKMISLPSTSWTYYWNLDVFLSIVSVYFLVGVLSGVPIGPKVQGFVSSSGKRLIYRMNGLFVWTVFFLVYFAAVYFKCPTVAVIRDKPIQALVIGFVLAVVVSFFLLFKARNLRPSQTADMPFDGCPKNPVTFFLFGKELNPRIFNFDCKTILIRTSCILSTLLCAGYIVEPFIATRTYPNPTMFAAVVMVGAYCKIQVIFEKALLSAAFYREDGVGFFLVFGCRVAFPYILLANVYYVNWFGPSWKVWELAGLVSLAMVGLLVTLLSNQQKTRFRENPYDANLVHLESISTGGSRRLLCSGWWGLCRHPNYLGEMIFFLAYALICGCKSGWPCFWFAFILSSLFLREVQIEASCAKRYSSAWNAYKKKVPYSIIPYIY